MNGLRDAMLEYSGGVLGGISVWSGMQVMGSRELALLGVLVTHEGFAADGYKEPP